MAGLIIAAFLLSMGNKPKAYVYLSLCQELCTEKSWQGEMEILDTRPQLCDFDVLHAVLCRHGCDCGREKWRRSLQRNAV